MVGGVDPEPPLPSPTPAQMTFPDVPVPGPLPHHPGPVPGGVSVPVQPAQGLPSRESGPSSRVAHYQLININMVLFSWGFVILIFLHRFFPPMRTQFSPLQTPLIAFFLSKENPEMIQS